MDEQKPRDVFFFEQDGSFVVRLLMTDQKGSHHSLAEFTREDIESLVAQGPSLRVPPTAIVTPGASGPAEGDPERDRDGLESLHPCLLGGWAVAVSPRRDLTRPG